MAIEPPPHTPSSQARLSWDIQGTYPLWTYLAWEEDFTREALSMGANVEKENGQVHPGKVWVHIWLGHVSSVRKKPWYLGTVLRAQVERRGTCRYPQEHLLWCRTDEQTVPQGCIYIVLVPDYIWRQPHPPWEDKVMKLTRHWTCCWYFLIWDLICKDLYLSLCSVSTSSPTQKDRVSAP